MLDLAVIGGGPGGYVAAIRAAQLGLSVVCIDQRATFGGTCLNVGCIPSKALLDSSEWYHLAKTRFAGHGLMVGHVGLDLSAMMKRKDGVVKSLTDGIAFLFKKNKVTAVHGSARLIDPHRIEVRSTVAAPRIIEAKNILLATGSDIVELPFMPFDHRRIVDSTDALAFGEVPERLIVVGAGYIGLELGSVWARLGSQVTVLEFLPRILPLSDGEMAGMVKKSLEKLGIQFQLGTKVTGARSAAESVTVSAVAPDGTETSYTADKVLVAVGRRPRSSGLGLEEIGVAVDAKSGRIPVDESYRTNISSIGAVGDLIAGPMLAHKAQEEGVAYAELLDGRSAHVNYDAIPSVIYTWPECASVGVTEEQLKESGRAYRVGRVPFSASGRARCMDETEGLVKVLADAETDRVLGVHIFGPRASDMIAEAVTILEFKGSAEDIARITHAHPTLSETLAEAARSAWSGAAIHA